MSIIEEAFQNLDPDNEQFIKKATDIVEEIYAEKSFTRLKLGELAERFEYLMLGDYSEWKTVIDENNKVETVEIEPTGRQANGFTIGRGKQLYWYISPSARTGKYLCYPLYENGEIGRPRYCYPETEITIHYGVH